MDLKISKAMSGLTILSTKWIVSYTQDLAHYASTTSPIVQKYTLFSAESEQRLVYNLFILPRIYGFLDNKELASKAFNTYNIKYSQNAHIDTTEAARIWISRPIISYITAG